MGAPTIVVLVVASGAAWESAALGVLGAHPRIVVLKRCVDVDDLLAAASAGQADVAVLGLDAPGLDAAAVDHLRGHGVRPVAVVAAGAVEAGRVRASRIGITGLVADDDLDVLPDAITTEDRTPVGPGPDHTPGPPPVPGPDRPVLAVWGPAGAPGRSTVAAGIAAELSRRELRTILVDADPHAASLGQQLGIVDGVSGLLAAARLTVGGQLEERFISVQRGIDARLSVVTGLPRPDRWVEVRAGALEHLLETARRGAHVVVDTGFSLEDDPAHDFGTRPPRNQLTLASLGLADEVVVVGSADPVGLSRLVRGIADLRELRPVTPLRVVVNRMRPSLGWTEKDVAGMVAGFARLSGLHFLPDDQPTTDRALVAGRTLAELGESPLSRALSALVDALLGSLAAGPGVRPQTAGTAHPR
jgi:MinD-like ATPase involved in chromosome partitioning or flagellar assembly